MSGLPGSGHGWAVEQRYRPTRPTGLGMLEISEAGSALALPPCGGLPPEVRPAEARVDDPPAEVLVTEVRTKEVRRGVEVRRTPLRRARRSP
jgi:hypothetical protein